MYAYYHSVKSKKLSDSLNNKEFENIC